MNIYGPICCSHCICLCLTVCDTYYFICTIDAKEIFRAKGACDKIIKKILRCLIAFVVSKQLIFSSGDSIKRDERASSFYPISVYKGKTVLQKTIKIVFCCRSFIVFSSTKVQAYPPGHFCIDILL